MQGQREEDLQGGVFKTNSTLLLDVLERLAIMETSGKIADEQRQGLILSTNKLSERLGEIANAIRQLDEVQRQIVQNKAELDIIKGRLSNIDIIFAEARGGLKTGKIVWSGIWAILGLAVGFVLMYLRSRGY